MGTIHRQQRAGDELCWEGVSPQRYEQAEVAGVLKHVLIGSDEGAPHFHLRYFRVPVGGHTALDRHPHDHGVYVLHGQGAVLLEKEWHPIGPGDAIYVEGEEVHQFKNTGDSLFGFLCVVPARRGSGG